MDAIVKMETAGWSDIRASLDPEGDGYRVDIPAHWKQGRTAYGGLTSALMLAGARKRFDDLPPLRSALINFVGPVTDSPLLTANLERKGRNVTSVGASAHVGDQAVGRAQFLFGAARDSKINVSFPAPDAIAPEDADPFTPEAARDMVPQFFHNFDTRLIAGARPMMGDEGYIRTWSRHKDAASRTGIESLLCLGDVLPPAAMPLLRKFAPVSSMSWMFNLLSDNPQTEDGWWQVEARLTAATGGYSSQVMRIWNTDGELVVEGMQSIAIFDG
ncbi:MAG: thioesterase family protein [Litorimonas sp.]